jgi:hypothetical protein
LPGIDTGDILLNQSVPIRRAAFIIGILAVAQFILQMSLLTKGMEYAAGSLIIDDTYYYLQTAWNAKVLGFVTFDGLHPTNGVQLLWFALIFLLALMAKSKAILLFTTLGLGFLLNGLCYLVILRIGAALKQPVLALFMASFWALQSLPFRIYSMGMENSLHALVFWCVIWQSVEFLVRIQNKDKPDLWRLTVVLTLLVWTRLDSALVAAVLFAFSVGMLAYADRHNLRRFWQRHSKVVVGSSLLAGFGLLVQLIAFRLMGDSFLPVSALVKTSSAGRGVGLEPVDKLASVIILGMPSILQGRLPTPILILLGISATLLVILARVAMRDHSDEIRAFLSLWSCLLVGEILYYAYVGFSGAEYTPYFIWYRSPSFIFWIITGSLIGLFALRYARLANESHRFVKWVPAGLSLAIFAVAIYMFAASINFTSRLYAARYGAALWIAENSPPDAIFAAWNTGELSFFSNRTFINLDGVINNVDYYERVLRGSMPLTEYLSENKVDYIVDYQTYASLPDFPVVRTFPIDDGSGRSIQIWQVAPRVSLNQ